MEQTSLLLLPLMLSADTYKGSHHNYTECRAMRAQQYALVDRPRIGECTLTVREYDDCSQSTKVMSLA